MNHFSEGRQPLVTVEMVTELNAYDISELCDATEEAIVLLAKKGFDPQYGARPVKRVIQTLVLNELAKKLLENEVDKEQIILLDAFDDELVFRNS